MALYQKNCKVGVLREGIDPLLTNGDAKTDGGACSCRGPFQKKSSNANRTFRLFYSRKNIAEYVGRRVNHEIVTEAGFLNLHGSYSLMRLRPLFVPR